MQHQVAENNLDMGSPQGPTSCNDYPRNPFWEDEHTLGSDKHQWQYDVVERSFPLKIFE